MLYTPGDTMKHNNQQDDKPVEEGEQHKVKIEDMGDKGDGIASVDGFVIFVPGAEEHQTYEIEITSVADNYAFAEIIR